ncbi:MAG TPA: VanZ family protein [Clostridiales bacterium]|nr:VanZ family protein [Clostridiales bacterium]
MAEIAVIRFILYAIRKVNLIPFSESVIINDKIDYTEIYLNVLVFVPFGIYISILKPDWSFIRKVIPIAETSLLFETLQYIFAIGAADITDFLMP